MVEFLVQCSGEFIDHLGLGEGLRVLFIGAGLEDGRDTAQPAHHFVEHLGGEIEDEVQFIGVTRTGEEGAITTPHPVFARDKGEIGENP